MLDYFSKLGFLTSGGPKGGGGREVGHQMFLKVYQGFTLSLRRFVVVWNIQGVTEF